MKQLAAPPGHEEEHGEEDQPVEHGRTAPWPRCSAGASRLSAQFGANSMKSAPKSMPSSEPSPPITAPVSSRIESETGNVSGLTKAIAIASSAPATRRTRRRSRSERLVPGEVHPGRDRGDRRVAHRAQRAPERPRSRSQARAEHHPRDRPGQVGEPFVRREHRRSATREGRSLALPPPVKPSKRLATSGDRDREAEGREREVDARKPQRREARRGGRRRPVRTPAIGIVQYSPTPWSTSRIAVVYAPRP